MYKVFFFHTWIHPKNEIGMTLFVKNKILEIIDDKDNADFIYIPSYCLTMKENVIDFVKTVNDKKLIILGPHIAIDNLSDDFLKDLKCLNKNIIFNLLSDWVINAVVDNLKTFKLYPMPFAVDVENFKEDKNSFKENKFFIYIKYRDLREVNILIDFVNSFFKSSDIVYNVVFYEKSYKEEDYIKIIKKSKFGIWLGFAESQGFALEECLSCNTPLFVCNVKKFNEATNIIDKEKYNNIYGTSIPYWDDRCGHTIDNITEINDNFPIFLENVEKNKYNPREFILENMNAENIFNKKWKPVIEENI